MFAKRVSSIQKLNRDVEILDRKITREISKLNQNIATQIKKKFKSIHPGLQIKIGKIRLEDFIKSQKQKSALCVDIVSVNGKYVHKDGAWVEPEPNVVREKTTFFITDNKISVERLEELCYELSEDLGINIRLLRINERYEWD